MRAALAVVLSLSLWQLAAHAANITSLTEVDGTVGQPLVYQITADNGPTSYSVSSTTTLTNLGLKLNKTTGLITGTPKAGGTFSITVSAKGPLSTASKKLSFVIAKIFVSFTSANVATGVLGQSFSFQLAAPVTSPKYSAIGLPSGLRISSSSGLISGKPTRSGVFAPMVTVASKTTIATELLSITINGGVAAPSAIALTPADGTVGVPFVGAFIAPAAAPITFDTTGLPPGLTTNGNFITGTPTTAGVYKITVTATNGVGSATVTLTFAVTPPSGSPIISSPLAVSADVATSFTYKFEAAGNTPISYTLDPTKLPRGLTQDKSGNIVGYPFDPGVFSIPVSAANLAGADNEVLVITVNSLAAATTSASIKFTDGYKDTVRQGDQTPSSTLMFTALVNTPGLSTAQFNANLNVDVVVGLYEFTMNLGDATSGGKFICGKSALFNFTDTDVNGRLVKLGTISFMLGRTPQVKITARRKGTDDLGGIRTIHSEQLTGSNKFISETIPVKIQIGDNLLAAFYAQAVGQSTFKTVRSRFGTFHLSTVKLKGAGSGTRPPVTDPP